MQSDQFDMVLGQFRSALKADGFDLRIQALKPGGVVVVEILHTAEACEDCLIPDERLVAMLTPAFMRVLPDVTGVEVSHQNVPS